MRNRFQTLSIVLHVLGSLLLVLGCILFLPLAVAFLCGEVRENSRILPAFLAPALLALGAGAVFKKAFRGRPPTNLQSLLICSLGWTAFSAVGALPFVIAIRVSYLDGFFETMSGFTTTGITMLTGLDAMPRSILFWRSLTQWVGGLGILTFFLAVTFQGGSAHRLFGAESHKIEARRPVPGMANTIKILWGIYAGMSAAVIAALVAAGMSPFDSVCHTFTALSTGGFSPHDASIEYYRTAGYSGYVLIEYILIIGMVLGGTNFLIHYRVIKGNWRAVADNTEMKYWWSLICAFTAAVFLERAWRAGLFTGAPWGGSASPARIEENFRAVLFQVVSIITTTGFATRDIASPFFGQAARILFLSMMVIGGCVGSTGGGIKVLRVAVLSKLIRREIYRLRTPLRSVSAVVVDGKRVRSDEIYRIAGLFFTWIFLLVIGGVITALFSDLDALSASSGMFSALGNIGPCYIPVEAMGRLSTPVKLTYIFGMLAGRLEILPVLLLFSPRAWRS